MRVTFDVKGLRPATARLEGVADRIEDPRPVFEAIARDLTVDERRRFDTQGFGQWPKLDPATIRRKLRKHQDPRILHATGTLERALTSLGAPGQRLEISRTQLRFGLEPVGAAYYGRFHQTGRGVPKRLVISVTPRQRIEISDHFRTFILNTPRAR